MAMQARATADPAAQDLDVPPDVSAPPPIGTERMGGKGLKDNEDDEIKCVKTYSI